MPDVTHLVYAALYESASLVSGWSDDEQIGVNDRMFRNVLDPLIAASPALIHLAFCSVSECARLEGRVCIDS